MSPKESPIAQNRAEELGFDLWESFVVPTYYDSLDLITARKPRLITGGRGCGKTMLLRYLCHDSQFSRYRTEIDDSILSHIGIYWKIDTQFSKMLIERGIKDDVWQYAFEHMATLMLSQEVLKSLESIANSNYSKITISDINNLDFSLLKAFNSEIPSSLSDLRKFLRIENIKFQLWVSQVNTQPLPLFLPKHFIIELIKEIKDQNVFLNNSNYFVYIDEYENALPLQQNIINTWLKHSEMPLIFNIAMKRNTFDINKGTVGSESLMDVHDYRMYDIENYYNDSICFDTLASEILCLRLWQSGNKDIPIDPNKLRSTSSEVLAERRSPSYRKKILSYAKKILPGLTQEELAIEVFTDNVLQNRLLKSIEESLLLKKSALTAQSFLHKDYMEASIIVPALLRRNNLIDTEILEEFNNLVKNKTNKFTGKTNWIQNNFIGCLLLIYEPLPRNCLFYSGLESFITMSQTNFRHFLELCNKSITNESLNNEINFENIKTINPKHQAEAAKQASTSFLKEVKACGNNGNSLHTFVLRLGTYFKYLHKRPTQSESEQNHFSIKDTPSDSIALFINEAIKWSVLHENPITKQKGGKNRLEIESFDYVLNPIYAPYFHISYRKKRKVEFSNDELNIFINGSLNSYQSFLNTTIKSLEIESNDSPTLFD